MVNAMIDITDFDWTPYARRDIEQIVGEVQKIFPIPVNSLTRTIILEYLNSSLPDPSSFKQDQKKMDLLLFPPGKCIHFYRDGVGVAGSIVPCTYFDEIEVTKRLVDDHSLQSGYNKIILDLMSQNQNEKENPSRV